MSEKNVCVYLGDKLAEYNFGESHPFGPYRHDCFRDRFYQRQLDRYVDILDPVSCDKASLLRFHTPDYIEKIISQSAAPSGYLDGCDTPAFAGMYDTSRFVAGSVLDAIDKIITGQYRHGFVPIGGLHHARRDAAAGFCVINDCAIAIETLFGQYGLQRVAYVDIDAHHGDGVFYSFESDPRLLFADIHEDGTFLYPGTGAITEIGKGDAAGMKLNIPLPPKSGDEVFFKLWPKLEEFVRRREPQFILLQCGADSIKGDPITDLELSDRAHHHAAMRLKALADEVCDGRLLALGGGGLTAKTSPADGRQWWRRLLCRSDGIEYTVRGEPVEPHC